MGLEPLQPDNEYEVTVSTPEGDITRTVQGDELIDAGITDHGTGYIDGPNDDLSGSGYYSDIQNRIPSRGSISDLNPGETADSGYYSSGVVQGNPSLGKIATKTGMLYGNLSNNMSVSVTNGDMIIMNFAASDPSGSGIASSKNVFSIDSNTVLSDHTHTDRNHTHTQASYQTTTSGTVDVSIDYNMGPSRYGPYSIQIQVITT